VRAVPGAGLRVPIWILGSSTFGAQVAAALGLPFVFASHFAPAMLFDAMGIYRERKRASSDHGGGEREHRPFRAAALCAIMAFRPALEGGRDESLGQQRHLHMRSPAGCRFVVLRHTAYRG